MSPSFYGAPRLMEALKDFEYLARGAVDVVLKTDGCVKIVVRDPDSGRQKTCNFGSINRAKEWAEDQLRPGAAP